MVSFRRIPVAVSFPAACPLLSLVVCWQAGAEGRRITWHIPRPAHFAAGKADSPLEAACGQGPGRLQPRAAQLEQYQYAEAAKTFESVVTAFPSWTAARFNLGLALLNMPDSDDTHDRAISRAETGHRHRQQHHPGALLSGRAAQPQGRIRAGPSTSARSTRPIPTTRSSPSSMPRRCAS